MIALKVNLVDGRELFLRADDSYTQDDLTQVVLDSQPNGWLALETFTDGTMVIAIRDISTIQIEEAPVVQ